VTALLKFDYRRSDLLLGMTEDRAHHGPLLATVGAALLALSLFLPWYGLSLTTNGIASAQQTINNVAQQYGNATLQNHMRDLGTSFSALAGHRLATLSAHQALKYISVILLILAAVAFFSGLLRLVGSSELPLSGSGDIALVGLIATVCVLFRMVDRPVTTEGFFSLSLSGGIWLALGSSLAILTGGIWPRRRSDPNTSSGELAKACNELSGWTP
jgi:hypothetical protein